MITTFAVERQTVHQIVREALRCAALESTPNEAIDVLSDALTLLDRIMSERGLSPAGAYRYKQINRRLMMQRRQPCRLCRKRAYMATAWIYDRDYHRFEVHRVKAEEVKTLTVAGETLVWKDDDVVAFIDGGRVTPWRTGQVQRIEECESPRSMFV